MTNFRFYIFYVCIFLQHGCLNKNDSAAKQTIPHITDMTLKVLNNFQKEVALSENIIEANKNKIKYHYNMVCKEDFAYHFSFLSDSTARQMLNLFEKRIFRSIQLNNKNCFHFFISSNSTTFSMEWTEIYLVYHNSSDQVCYGRVSHSDGGNVPEKNVIKIKENWYIIMVEQSRVLRG